MLALRELQRAFRDSLVLGHSMAALSVVVGAGVSPARRIDVYRNNVFHNYTEALRAVYPVVERLVGEAFFAGAARKYIVAYPSASGDLHDYGLAFGAFLDAFPPAATLPYLGDVARLEWLWHECFHGAEHSPLSLERLGRIADEAVDSLRFRLHPACRLLASRYPVGKIWAVNQAEWPAATDVDLHKDGAARLLLRRDGFAIVIESLSEAEFELLRSLANGEPLVCGCERAGATDTGFELGPFLKRLVEAGVLVDFSTDEVGRS